MPSYGDHIMTERKNGKLEFYFKASVLGAIRGGACLILEHPLDSIKTQWQDKTYFKSTNELVTHIYREKGIMGFYRGFIPNLVRVMSKNFYRWPLMIFFPRFYDKNLPSLLRQKFTGITKILTGLSIANIEIFIMTPLDRIKIFLMTTEINSKKIIESTENKNLNFNSAKEKLENKYQTRPRSVSTASKLLYFYQNHKQNIFTELFRGLEPTFWRSNVSWVSFLYLDHRVKRIFKYYLNKEKLSFTDLFFVSIFVGVGNLVAVMPFDFVKTQMQKEGYHKEKTFEIMKKYYNQEGIRVLYTGSQFKLLQYILQSIFTVVLLDKLEINSQHL